MARSWEGGLPETGCVAVVFALLLPFPGGTLCCVYPRTTSVLIRNMHARKSLVLPKEIKGRNVAFSKISFSHEQDKKAKAIRS